jgi:hypothetical protein
VRTEAGESNTDIQESIKLLQRQICRLAKNEGRRGFKFFRQITIDDAVTNLDLQTEQDATVLRHSCRQEP